MADEIVEAFATINQNLVGSKARIITSQSVASSINSIPVHLRPHVRKPTTETTPVLGGYVTPDSSTSVQLSHFREYTSKIEAKYARLKDLDAAKQDKLLILKAITFDYLYAAETFLMNDTLRHAIFDHIDLIQLSTFNAIFHAPTLTQQEKQKRHVLLFTPTEDGGLNLIPYSQLQSFLGRKAETRASDFVSSHFGHNIPNRNQLDSESPCADTLKAHWVHSIKEQHIAARIPTNSVFRATFQRVTSLSRTWHSVLPTTKINTLSDEEIEFAINVLFKQLQPDKALCKQTPSLQLQSLSASDYFHHIMTCVSCAAKNWHHRHEEVNNMLHRTLRHHAVTSSLNPKDYPLPEKTKGGPDIVFWHAGETYSLDVAITQEDPEMIFQRKTKKYEQHIIRTKHILLPFVSSIFGTLCARTIALLKPLWYYPYPNNDFREALLTNFQFALIRGMIAGIKKFTFQNSDFATSITHLANTNTNHFPSQTSLSPIPNPIQSFFSNLVSQQQIPQGT